MIVVLVVLLVAAAATGQANLLEGTFTTPLDHSRPQDPTIVTFVTLKINQLYLVIYICPLMCRDILQTLTITNLVDLSI